ncbi:hypothetical protein [Bacillus solitudinis]|uniref:hypothetical protein n=1 Tax=Bacillus solitudinis TaxID=2014074 RepID=UPI000C24B199|nr:hypothetical protein [Bacillus solitudinis]
MDKKKSAEVSNASKEKAEEVKAATNESARKEFIDPWEQLLFGGRKKEQPQETQDTERQQTKVEGNEDSEKSDGKEKGFSWI